jgi:hypothetical protein
MHWDIRHKPSPFIAIEEPRLDDLRDHRINPYVMHTPWPTNIASTSSA